MEEKMADQPSVLADLTRRERHPLIDEGILLW